MKIRQLMQPRARIVALGLCAANSFSVAAFDTCKVPHKIGYEAYQAIVGTDSGGQRDQAIQAARIYWGIVAIAPACPLWADYEMSLNTRNLGRDNVAPTSQGTGADGGAVTFRTAFGSRTTVSSPPNAPPVNVNGIPVPSELLVNGIAFRPVPKATAVYDWTRQTPPAWLLNHPSTDKLALELFANNPAKPILDIRELRKLENLPAK